MGYKIIRPRRGIKSLWDAYKDKIYKTGEMLVESPESGVGTGPVNVKFGDGMTPYYALPYAIEAPINQAIEGSTKPITSGAVYEQNKNLDDLLKWKTYGTQILTGANFINLSDLDNAKEVLFQIPINNSYDVYVDILVPIDVLKSTSVTYRRAGYFFNSTGYLLAQAQVGNMLARTEIYVSGAGIDGLKTNILYR